MRLAAERWHQSQVPQVGMCRVEAQPLRCGVASGDAVACRLPVGVADENPDDDGVEVEQFGEPNPVVALAGEQQLAVAGDVDANLVNSLLGCRALHLKTTC